MSVRLMLGLFAVASASSCVDLTSKSSLNPDGPPVILQVFVRDPADSDDPIAGEYALVYGIHEDALRCSFDQTCACPFANPDCIFKDTICDRNPNSDTFDHCVTSSGRLPAQRTASAFASIRIVSDELLSGTTLEQFACACQGTGRCPAGGEWAIDPENCRACGEDPDSPVEEGGRCLDVNRDGKPDISTLQAGVATISCGDLATFPPYRTALGDGYYYPSGSRFPTSGYGYGGIGPAVVIEPAAALPTSTTCTIMLDGRITDKDGVAFQPTSEPITFRVEPLHVERTSPGDQETEVRTDRAAVTITYNAPLAVSTVTPESVQIRKLGSATPLPGTGLRVNEEVVSIQLPAGTLEPATTYEVTLTTAITDAYGVAAPVGETFTFETGAGSAPQM
jgi:hypothetical protein